VDEKDLSILSEQGVSIATNPVSNLKLASGVMPLTKVLASGVNLCMGSDSAASNNTQNMFKEMNMFSLIHKGVELDALAAPASLALQCATVNGAKALGMEGQIGDIQTGMKADIILLNMNRAHLQPMNSPITALAYAANGSEVETVVVNGEVLMEKNELKTLDEEKIFAECRKVRDKYLKK
jgi:5-methylthioadenosine/S-adenosylhomocysteine deaminase